MGGDLNADDRAAHGVPGDVLEAERGRLAAELADLERDRARRFAEVDPEGHRALLRKADELAKVDTAIGARAPRFEVRRLAELGADWLEAAPPPAPTLLTFGRGTPFMRSGVVASLVAPGGTGKTFALVQLAVAIASGAPWLGTYKPTAKGGVFLGLAEEDADEVRRRLFYVTRTLDAYQRTEVLRNIAAEGFAGRDVAFLRRTPDKNIGKTEWFDTFKAALERSGPWRAIIVDPWSRWGGVDAETDAHAATFGVRLLEELATLEGAPAVIAAHHTRKASKGATGPTDASDARGSSAFVDGGRFTMNLGRHGESLLSLRVTKTNGTVPGPELILARGEHGTLRPATPDEIADATPTQPSSGARRTRAPATTPTPTNGDRRSPGAGW